jgi:predicted Fe-Mo cluster-binding NifX family protein
LIGVNVALSLLNLSIAAPYRGEPKAKGIRVAEWLVAQKVDRVLPKQSLHGKRPEYVFADAGVGMTLVEADSLNQALEALDR